MALLCVLAPLEARCQAKMEEVGSAATTLPLYAPPPAVLHVGNHGPEGEIRASGAIYAQRNDEIWLDICNFEGWIDELRQQKKLPNDHEPKHLILYLDHIPLIGVPSIYNYPWLEKKLIGDQWMESRMTTVCFRLVRSPRSKEAWSHFLNQPVLTRQAVVSAGFDNGEEIPSYLRVDGKVKDGQFFLRIIPPAKTALGTAIIFGALLAFLWLARHTHIIRDTSAPRRPDGVRPYSLARSQMAFWFFLVVSAYFFLWIITGDMDTLNTSVLGLPASMNADPSAVAALIPINPSTEVFSVSMSPVMIQRKK